MVSAVLISCAVLYVAYSKLCRGKLFNRERKPQAMSEKRPKTKKFAIYQNVIVRNSPALGRHDFVSSVWFWRNAHDQYTNPLARLLLIALQVVRTSFGFHLRECMGSSFPPPPPETMSYQTPVPNGRRRSGLWLVPENFCFYGTNQKPKRRRRPFVTGLVRHCPHGLFSPFFTFLFRPFRLFLVPTICPWVSEDAVESERANS